MKELLKLLYKFFLTFVLQRFADEVFQFEFFVLFRLCIMRHQKVDYEVVFLWRDKVKS